MRSTMDRVRRLSPRQKLTAAGVLVVVVIAAALTFGRSGTAKAGGAPGGGPPAMPPMPVDVDTARYQSVVDAVRATGRIEALQAVDLRPDEQGRVTGLHFYEGQFVGKGAALVTIDDAMPRAQAERAAAERDLARQARARAISHRKASSAAIWRAMPTLAARAALAVLPLQIGAVPVASVRRVVGRASSRGRYVTSGMSSYAPT